MGHTLPSVPEGSMTDDERDALLLRLETKVDGLGSKVDRLESLRGEVETLGRETRREWAELRRDLPQAVVAAVERVIGPELHALRTDVDELKRASGE